MQDYDYYENSLCCYDYEHDIIWSDTYMYRKEKYSKSKLFEDNILDLEIPF